RDPRTSRLASTGPRMIAVFLLARFYRDRQSILLRRQRASSESNVGARRIVGLVEVEHDEAVFRLIRIQKTARRVRRIATGGVLEHERKVAIFFNGIQTLRLAVDRELGVAGRWLIVRHPENIDDFDFLRLRIRYPFCLD